MLYFDLPCSLARYRSLIHPINHACLHVISLWCWYSMLYFDLPCSLARYRSLIHLSHYEFTTSDWSLAHICLHTCAMHSMHWINLRSTLYMMYVLYSYNDVCSILHSRIESILLQSVYDLCFHCILHAIHTCYWCMMRTMHQYTRYPSIMHLSLVYYAWDSC